jgi:hypothetical protein
LASGVAASHGLSAETIADIVAKTDGVPLFVEELTKAVMESGFVRLPSLAINESLSVAGTAEFSSPAGSARAPASGVAGIASTTSAIDASILRR